MDAVQGVGLPIQEDGRTGRLGQKGANDKPFFAEGVGAENGEGVAVIPADNGGHSFVGNGGGVVWHMLFTLLLSEGLRVL